MGPAVVACLVIAGAGVAVMAVTSARLRRAEPDLDEFLDGLGYQDFERNLSRPVVERLATTVGRVVSARVERLAPGNYIATLDRSLARAGLAPRRRAGQQLAVQLGLAAAGLALAGALPVGSSLARVLTLVLLPAAGFMLPGARLKRRVRARTDAIFKDLPDIVDMLAIAVEAGSGFESALSVVCENFDSPLTDELSIALQEMELGLPRREALQQLRDRVELDAVRMLVLSLLQADALGIPIGRVLKTQATEVRARRRAWAREKAAKLPVKIMFPLVLFIFPPIMGLVLGPAASSFGKLGGG
jgi:tight adherence protein C